MATTQEYALLSLLAYPVRLEENAPRLPGNDWTMLESAPDNVLGLAYSVFRRAGTGEVVIAYTGTNNSVGDFVTDGAAAVGLPDWQIANAALVYQQVKQKYGNNITLTGHSLGGGLASVMAVWFDRPAVVFDAAPFQLTAANPVMLAMTQAKLAALGYSDPAISSAISDFINRETRVAHRYLQGEFLNDIRTDVNSIAGSDTFVAINGAFANGIQLHSMALLAAAEISDSFRQATYASNSIIPLLLDENFYAFDTVNSSKKNFLVDLIRSEQKSVPGQGKLAHFAVDMQRFGVNAGGLGTQAQDALVAQSMEWYYWQGLTYSGQEFFTRAGNLLQYGIATSLGIPNALNKAAVYVQKWLAPIVNDHNEFYTGDLAAYEQWNVVTGGGSSTGSALDAAKRQIFVGGTASDSFTGGHKDDVMFAGDGADIVNGAGGGDKIYGGGGADTLDGGAGSDYLYGGAGADKYSFNGAFGSDWVIDSDGQGSLWVGDQQIQSAKKVDDDYWISDDKQFGYARVANAEGGHDLLISRGSQLDQIRIRNWTGNGMLGITLSDEAAQEPVPRTTFSFDFAKKLKDGSSTDYLFDANGNYVPDPMAPAGPQPDLITGTGNADKLSGGLGNDGLAGRAGDDLIEGGEGGDLLMGGAGPG